MIEFNNLTRLTARIFPRVQERWKSESFETGSFIEGPPVRILEQILSETLGTPNVVSCANGTDALEIALKAAGIGRGHRVALPNLTFWATYEAVVNVGAEPVLVDIDATDLQLSLSELEQAHSKFKLNGVILVHLFGWASAKLEEIRGYCKNKSLLLLEDGAQAFGTRYSASGSSIFSKAALATLSFYPTKVLGGCGDGGAILTSDKQLAERCRVICNHGRLGRYAYSEVGRNSRMSVVNAIYLQEALRLMPEIIEQRRRIEATYFYQAKDLGIRCYQSPEGISTNGYLSVFAFNSRQLSSMIKIFDDAQIEYRNTYPETIDMQTPAKDALKFGTLEVSRTFVKEVFNPPIFPFMSEDEIALVAACFAKLPTSKAND